MQLSSLWGNLSRRSSCQVMPPFAGLTVARYSPTLWRKLDFQVLHTGSFILSQIVPCVAVWAAVFGRLCKPAIFSRLKHPGQVHTRQGGCTCQSPLYTHSTFGSHTMAHRRSTCGSQDPGVRQPEARRQQSESRMRKYIGQQCRRICRLGRHIRQDWLPDAVGSFDICETVPPSQRRAVSCSACRQPCTAAALIDDLHI